MAKTLAIICARGGSKSIPKKNIKLLLGKPLIYYTLKIALKCKKEKIIDEIVLSTDSEEIAAISKKYGISADFCRPDHLATDECGKIDVIRHALINSERIHNKEFGNIIDLDVTSPIRTKEDIKNCLNLFRKKKPDVVFSVVNSRKNPYFNMVEIHQDGFAALCKKPKKLLLRRQDAPKVYDMNTSIYIYSRKFLLNPKNVSLFSSTKTLAYQMDGISAVDIDNPMDFKYIEFLIKEGMVEI